MSQIQRNVGWVGERPFDVYLAPLKSVLRIRREINSPIKSERILSLTNDRGVIPYEEKGAIGNNVSEDISRYSLVHIGDIVMNSMNVIIGSVGLSKYEGALSPVYYVLQPVNGDQMDMRYFAYHFGMPTFYKQLARIGYGILEHRMRIPWINLQNELMFVPPVAKQKTIADYLDRETARIDALITKKQRIIVLFRERRRALITAAVTGELGVSHRLKSLASLVVDQTDRGELPYLALEHLESGTGALAPGVELLSRHGGEPGVSAVRHGDVLFGKLRPYLAKTLLVREPAYASTELMALRPGSAVESRYLAYLVGSRPLIEWSTANSDGTKMPRTSWEKLGEFRVEGVPGLTAQRAIADYLDAETARIDALVEKTKRMVEMLSEHRQALITAAVTGELEIPEVAA